MEPATASVPTPPTVVFRDGLGERRHIVDATGREAMELLCLRSELASVASFEFALRERVSHLSGFRHAHVARVRGVERLGLRDATLAIVSESTSGIRLSDMLAEIEERHVALDINTALCLLSQLVPAVAALHETSTEVAHGALAPERLIITPQARLVVVEHVVGAALEQLRFSQERYWSELRITLPKTSGQPRFDQRADVTAIGAIALSLLLGRPLHEDEYPARVTELVASTWAVSARGGFEPLPAGLRAWLGRALQLDPRTGFASAVEARTEFEKLVGDTEIASAPASLEQFLTRYHEELASDPSASPTSLRHRVKPAPQPPNPAPVDVVAVVDVHEDRPAVPVIDDARFEVEVEDSLHAPVESAKPVFESSPAFEAPKPVFEAPKPVFDAPKPVVAAKPVVDAPAFDLPKIEITPVAPAAHERSSKPASTPVVHPALADLLAKPVAAAEETTMVAALFENAPALKVPSLPSVPSSSKTTPRHEEPKVHAKVAKGGGQRSKLMAIAAGILVIVVSGGFAARKYLSTGAPVTPMGTLTVTTDPAGAALIVDGEARGATPMTLSLAAGPHTVELSASGNTRSIPVTISEGKESSQYIELGGRGTNGQLQVKTDPAGAQVSVDGVARGTSPLTVSDLAPGEHAVVLTSGLGSVKHSVTVEQGTTASLVVSLGTPDGAPLSGWISVSAPVDVQIFERDKLLGTSATDQIMVSAGRHDIEIVNDTLGYRVTRTLQVPAGKTISTKIDLPRGTLALQATPWAEVWIDGERVGETPIGNLPLTIGPHEVLFRHPELGEQRQTATVTLKGATRLSVDLRKK